MKCEYCGRYNPPGNTDCKYCNAPLPVPLKPFDTPAYIAEACAHFGTTLGETSVFCEICGHISPAVHENIRQNPQKKSLDYIGVLCDHHGHQYIDCPHCGNVYYRSFYEKNGGAYLRTPIKCCTSCYQYFLTPQDIEWSVASPEKKKRKYAAWQSESAFLVWDLAYTFLPESLSAVPVGLYSLVNAAVCTFLRKNQKQERITESQLRLERNPEYPLILAKMGYIEVMDQKYHYLLNYKPTRLSDFLKDAFTFE